MKYKQMEELSNRWDGSKLQKVALLARVLGTCPGDYDEAIFA